MALKTWRSKWNYLTGKEQPLNAEQRLREWVVNKFGAGVLTLDNADKYKWYEAYVKDGARSSMLNKHMHSCLPNYPMFAQYKARLAEIATQNALRHWENQEHNLAKNSSGIHIETKPVITSKSPGYAVPEEQRRTRELDELVTTLLQDPTLNPLVNDPELKTIEEWASYIDQDKPEYMEQAKELHQNRKKIKLNPDQLALADQYQKAELLFMRRDAIRKFVADAAVADITGHARPFYADFGSGYFSYLTECQLTKKTPKAPATFWDVTFYGLRLLNPISWANAIVGGICEGAARLICAGIDKCFKDKTSTKAIATKAIVTTVLGLTVVDGALHFTSKACSVSGLWSGVKSIWSGIKNVGRWIGKKCGCIQPVRVVPANRLVKTTQVDRRLHARSIELARRRRDTLDHKGIVELATIHAREVSISHGKTDKSPVVTMRLEPITNLMIEAGGDVLVPANNVPNTADSKDIATEFSKNSPPDTNPHTPEAVSPNGHSPEAVSPKGRSPLAAAASPPHHSVNRSFSHLRKGTRLVFRDLNGSEHILTSNVSPVANESGANEDAVSHRRRGSQASAQGETARSLFALRLHKTTPSVPRYIMQGTETPSRSASRRPSLAAVHFPTNAFAAASNHATLFANSPGSSPEKRRVKLEEAEPKPDVPGFIS